MQDDQIKQNMIPDEQAQEAIASGSFAPKPNQEIAVISPDGMAGTVPGYQIKDAIDQGYKIETARQGAVREYVETQKKSPFTAAKVFAGQALDEALLGIPERIYDANQNPFELEKKTALKKEYEAANTAGGILGFGASFLAPGANLVFKGAEKAGRIAEKAVAARLAAAGVEKGSGKLAQQLLSRTAELTARGATEGLVMTAPVAITEQALGNPDAAAEALMIGGGLGAVFGAATGTAGTLFNKLKKFKTERAKINPAVEAESSFVNEAGEKTMPDPTNAGDGTLVGSLKAEGISENNLKMVQEDLQKLKPNYKEITQAADILELPVLEEQVTSSKFIQDQADVLANRPTMAGKARNELRQQRYGVYDDVVKNSLGDVASGESAFEVGQKVKDQIVQKAEEAIAPQRKIFQDLEMQYETVPLYKKSMDTIARNIDNLQLARVDREARGIAKDISNALRSGQLENLSDLKQFRTTLYGMGANTPNRKRIIGEIAEKLNGLEESSIERAISDTLGKRAQPGMDRLVKASEIQDAFNQMKKAKADWRNLAEQFSEAGDALSMGNIKNPGDFIEKARSMKTEDFVKKMIPKNDVESMTLLQKKFPDQFELVKNFSKSKLIEDSVKDGAVQVGSFIGKYKKLTKEMKAAMFTPDQIKKLNAVVTDFESLPRIVNPSGTAKATDIIESMNAGMTRLAWENVKDYATAYKIQKSVSIEAILGTEKELERVRKRLFEIPDVVEKAINKTAPIRKSIDSKKTIDAVNRLLNNESLPKQDALRLLQNELSNNKSSETAVFNKLQNDVDAISEAGAPQVAAAFARNAMKTAEYIYENYPKPMSVQNPMVKKYDFKPSDMEMAKFERKLSVALDPFSAITALEENSLTKDHVESLSYNYPLLYSAMKNKIVERLIEKPSDMSYQAQLKMSLFLGMNVSQSLSQESVQIYQNAFNSPAAIQENDAGLNDKGLMKLGKDTFETTATQFQRIQNKI